MATTWNPADKDADITLSNGNLTAAQTTADWGGVRANISKTSGKWYWEITAGAMGTDSQECGFANSSADVATLMSNSANGWGYRKDGTCVTNGGLTFSGTSWTTNDVIGLALDADLGLMWVAKNNTWQNSGNPGAGTGAMWNIADGTQIFPMWEGATTPSATANFGATALTYSAPSGFSTFDTPPSTTSSSTSTSTSTTTSSSTSSTTTSAPTTTSSSTSTSTTSSSTSTTTSTTSSTSTSTSTSTTTSTTSSTTTSSSSTSSSTTSSSTTTTSSSTSTSTSSSSTSSSSTTTAFPFVIPELEISPITPILEIKGLI